MTIVSGNLWTEIGRADILLVTTNACRDRDGRLVMGRGAAYEASVRYPDLAALLGRFISLRWPDRALPFYGGLLSGIEADGTQIGAFQVKYDWRQPADLEVIRRSATGLAGWLARERDHGQEPRVALNFPGIGNGWLEREKVLPVLACLPASVFVYELPMPAGRP